MKTIFTKGQDVVYYSRLTDWNNTAKIAADYTAQDWRNKKDVVLFDWQGNEFNISAPSVCDKIKYLRSIGIYI